MIFETHPPAPQGGDYFRVSSQAPLAARMRPVSLEEVVGQKHLLGDGRPLRRLIEGDGAASVILYGPPGTGKTTIASLISQATNRSFQGLSALDTGVKEIRAVIEQARFALRSGQQTVLFIDEVHRFSKNQQDALLAAVERRDILLVAATTENPSFSVVAPLLSRSLVLHLQPLSEQDIGDVLQRAVGSERGLNSRISLSEDARALLVQLASGDARRSLTYLEAAAEAVPDGGEISVDIVEKSMDRAVVRYDRDGDQHYDVTSAFIKSIRGSDPDAAIHYLARMIEAGEDPRFIARRLIIHAAEDIGLADPHALTIAVAAADAAALIGLPEARIPLAEATIYLATAPKSNAALRAIDAAIDDIRKGKTGTVPAHLRDGHYSGAKEMGNSLGYIYPHDSDLAVVAQQYLPDPLCGTEYYRPTDHGGEKRLQRVLERLRQLTRG
ncbi:replication-associated recombination protein A [Corynebacterium sp. ES2794-CONJ1]|uniref:replication-associated recombination protein A n=1 Tax=unclassified Corynebacterium TaxID=2624378 RepID=UPI002168D3D9|nr:MULTISPECIES: replication-associated recombination protein A [unclassified Corynebacterium]MCS4489248.1 replication-associated recombination protein A [Corynebacterium sp. ES2775-CONJ]MCS4491061.1 replication-associated recombination protein A [Corynebacterium sp. ES2715-CONJ3]MCS4531058.1 replication-associated recombination protein A [Corynebacterium sp. ES2730-CONJ]MCU9518425.1 replication-associated recombination protein A [Corynebacterium sp. ES2794-CONJ1]